MYSCTYKVGNYNPAGIEINLGFYALAEVIVTGRQTSIVLEKWCGIRELSNESLNLKADFGGDKSGRIVDLLNLYGFSVSNIEIAKMCGCSKELVTKVLRKLGISKRNRWDGYISKDKRYSKNKKGEIK